MQSNKTSSKKATIILAFVATVMLAGAALAGDGVWTQNPITGAWSKTLADGSTITCDKGVNTCSINKVV